MSLTFTKDFKKRKREAGSWWYTYGLVKNRACGVSVPYKARRSRLTGRVWIYMRLNGWQEIKERHLFDR